MSVGPPFCHVTITLHSVLRVVCVCTRAVGYAFHGFQDMSFVGLVVVASLHVLCVVVRCKWLRLVNVWSLTRRRFIVVDWCLCFTVGVVIAASVVC